MPCHCGCNCHREKQPVTKREAIAAAQARVTADRLRGVTTDPRVIALAQEDGS